MITIDELAEIVGRTVKLRRAGKGYNGRCPFGIHQDRHPSFYLFTGGDGKPRFKCQSCGERGDLGDFLKVIGSPTSYRPDPEFQKRRREQQRCERAYAAYRDHNPDCVCPEWLLIL